MEVRLHPAARQELVDSAEWYAAQAGQRVAQDFVADYDEARLRALNNPRIGSPSSAQTRRLIRRRFPFALIVPAFEHALRAHRADVDAIADHGEPPTFANTVAVFDRIGRDLGRIEKLFFNLAA